MDFLIKCVPKPGTENNLDLSYWEMKEVRK